MAGAPKGNTNSSRENRMISDALKKVVTQGPDKLRDGCMKLLDRVAEGDLAAFTYISDRLEGKPAQSHTIGGDEENPLKIVNEVLIAPLNNDDSNNTDT